MRVVLATDGSSDARVATEWLSRLPLPEPTSVRVVTVVALSHALIDIPTIRQFNDELVRRGRQIADDARAGVATRWPDVDIDCRKGDARDQILRAVQDWNADMIVVGARGLGTFKGWLLGSVSTAAVRHASCPVLVVRGPRPGFAKFIIAVDGSPDSIAAARFLTSWPLPPTVTLSLLGVVEPMQYPLTMFESLAPAVVETLENDQREREAALRKTVAVIAADLRTAARVEHTVAVGSPVEQIIAATQAPDVDLVVVGARGLGAAGRLLLGSVSEGVLHHAHCPVLFVKHPRR